jgi:tetratricopeptide (TPR) repeat protein
MSQFSMAIFKICKGQQSIGLMLVLIAATFHLTTGVGLAQSRPASVQSGYSLLERGWVNDAIRAFRQALQQNPQSLEAKLGLAVAYQRAGQDAEAWNTYQQVLAQDPNQLQALAAIGQLGSYRLEWQQPGITALTTLLTLQPENTTARSQRALLYGYQGDFVAAISDYEQVLSSNSSATVVLEAAQIYTFSGDFQTGLELFDRYLVSNSVIPDRAVSAYALALQKSDRIDAAIQVLTKRLQQVAVADPVAFDLRSSLAIAYAANQQPEQALATLEPLRNRPGAILPLARALSTMGRQTQDQGLYAEAIALYQQALAQTSKPSIGLRVEVADSLSEEPTTRLAALQLYQQVLAEQPDDLGIQVKSLWLSYQLGQLPLADFRSQIQQLVQPLPTARVEQQQLAQALIRINPPDPALLDVYQALLATNQPFLQFRIAQIELQQGDTAAARQSITAYQQTVTGATDPAAELLLAEIERQEGNLEDSAQRYIALAERYPNRPAGKDARRGLAGIRLAQGRSAEALQVYEQLQTDYPDDLAIEMGRMAIAYQQRQISEAAAVTVLDNWQTLPTVEFPPELFLLAAALPAAPEREALYDALLELEPDNVGINRRWVQLWALRDPDKAQARVNQLLTDYPDQPEIYFVQGELAQALGDLDLASQSYQAILAQQPDQLDALAALAGIRFQQQRYAEAETLYQQVLAQRPGDPEIRRVLVELDLAQDRPVAAWQQLSQLRQEQAQAGVQDPQIDDRAQQLQIDFLKRRGFQPRWERY